MESYLGKGILLKLPYADGGVPNKLRTFIIIGSNGDTIEMLNVSTAKGKEKKMSFPSNELLKVYKPPFCRPSFVKLDGLYKIQYFQDLEYCILFNGHTLFKDELNRITDLFKKYKECNVVNSVYFNIDETLRYNSYHITKTLAALGKQHE